MHSTLGVYDICPLKASTCMCSKLPFAAVLPVSRFTVKSFYPLSTFDAAHIRKNNRLSSPAQGQCLHPGVWEQGYHLPSLTLSLTVADVPVEDFETKTLRPHCVYHTDGLGMGLIKNIQACNYATMDKFIGADSLSHLCLSHVKPEGKTSIRISFIPKPC